MGLFFTEAGAQARKGTQGPRNGPKGRITEAQARLLGCAQCPLDRAILSHPKMLPTGAGRPLLYFLGEAPGAEEDKHGTQFIGNSGEFLRGFIPTKWERHIRWNNSIRCRPPGNRDPEQMELACCRHLQVEDIERSKPKVIVGFGNVPLHWMLGSEDRKISDWRGRRMPVKVGSHVCWFYPIGHPSGILHSRNDKKKGEANERAFTRDLERMFAEIDLLPAPYVEDPNDYYKGVGIMSTYGTEGIDRIETALGHLADQDHAVDIETDRLRPYSPDARILSIAAGTYDQVFAFPWEHPEARWSPRERKRISDIVEAYVLGQGRKWTHSAKFEQEWFYSRFGADVLYKTQWGDTLAQAHVLDERKGKGLDALTQLHFGFRLKALIDVDPSRQNLANVPLSKVLPYNALDSKYCFALSIVQGELLENEGRTHVYELLHGATPGIVRMQAKGMVRDTKAGAVLAASLEKEANDLTSKILHNEDVIAFSRKQKFSPSSNPDLVFFFRDFLKIPNPGTVRKGGALKKSHLSGERKDKKQEEDENKYSVDEGVLSQIDHPVAKAIVQLRTASKMKSTYVDPLLDGGKNVHGDGLVHPSYSNYITVSGRLAAEEPNAQNFPRRERKEIRRIIGCPPGHSFVAFDYKQLEWRIGASLSGDPIMCQEIVDGKDIHGDWTDMIGGKFVPKLVKENRKKVRDSIKQMWTFANLYGNVIEGIAQDLSNELGVEITPRALEPSFIAFWNRYPHLQQYQEALVSTYWETGYVETATGQRRHEPCARNEVINHPFQGTAGHLVIDAQSRLSYRAWKEGRPSLLPMLNVHDDLSFYLPNATIEQDIEDIAREMCCVPFEFITTPLAVEVSVGDNWCDKSELAEFSTTDFL